MSLWACLFPQIQPWRVAVAKNRSRYLGMLSDVLAHRTTSVIGFMNFAEYFALIVVSVPVPTVGAVPLMLCRTKLPCSSQPNLFCVLVGLTPHLAEWNFCEIHFATEYGTIALGLLANCESVPSFC